MPGEGPRRLKEGPDTPEALRRALTALHKGVDDTAHLQRVSQKLDSMFNPPPPPSAAPSGVGAGLSSHALTALKLVVAGLGLLAPLLYFQHSDESDQAASPSAGAAVSSAGSASVSPPVAKPASTSQLVTEPDTEPVAKPATTLSHSATAHEKRTTRAMRPAPGRARDTRARPAIYPDLRRRRPAAALNEHADATGKDKQVVENAHAAAASVKLDVNTDRDLDRNTPAQPNGRASAHVEMQDDAVARLQAPKPKPQPSSTVARTPVPTEAELLFRARQASKRDAPLALQILSEHKARYPKGRLVPEREVLAIEALRSLGHKQEADKRLRQFEARYPKSIHLRRLLESQ